MKIVGMKQLRQKFEPIRKGLEGGEEYLLMYRSKPLAVLRPYQANEDAQHLQSPRVSNQPAVAISPTAMTPTPQPTPAKIINKAREIATPKTTYSDVINGYQSRVKNNKPQAVNSKPKPMGNPLGKLNMKRAFV